MMLLKKTSQLYSNSMAWKKAFGDQDPRYHHQAEVEQETLWSQFSFHGKNSLFFAFGLQKRLAGRFLCRMKLL